MARVVAPPFLVAFNLTRRCNLRCAHCYLDAGTRRDGDADELTSGEVEAVLDDIASLDPGTMVVLTGGEPILRPDIERLARYASDLGLMVVVGTNGVLLNEARVERLDALGVDSFAEYSLPQAVIRFKQGFGRLIRTRDDTGAVLVLDKRVATKRYGQVFLNSLPAETVHRKTTHDLMVDLTKFFGGNNGLVSPQCGD